MADLEQMKRALVNADAAGDAEAARTLAQAIRSQMSGPAPRADAQTANPRGMNTLLQGVTFGLADEAAGAGAAAGRFLRSVTRDGRGLREAASDAGDAYNRTTGRERASVDQFKQDNPVLGPAMEIGGGFLGAAPRMAAGATVNLARGIEPATTAGAALQSAKAGAAGGALAGFGSAEGGLENRLEGAAAGGALGGTIGGSIPLIATGVSRAAGRATDALGLRNPQTGGDRQLLRAFERDAAGGGPNIEQVYGRTMSNVGQDARPEFLADMGGENVRRLAAMTTQTPGAARQTAQTAIGERTAGQADRISDDVMRLLSPNSDWHGTVDALQKSRATAAQPLYEAAMSRNAWSPRVDDFINDPIAKQGLARGFQIQRLESVARGQPFDPKQMGVTFKELPNGEFGDPVLVGRPNMRALDMVKAGLDDILEGYRDGVTGKLRLDRTGKAIDEFRRSYIGTLDDLNPDYKAARQAWAGPSQAMDALAKGRNVFRPDDEITAQMVKGMSPGDKEMFLAGVSRAIRDRVENSADGRNAVATFFSKQSFRDKLRAAFPNEQAYRRFEGLMQRETGMFEGQRVYGPGAGPATARNLADAADATIDPMQQGGVLSALATGNLPGAARSAIEGTMRRAQGMNSSTADYLGPIMFNSNQEKNAAQLARLLSQRQTGQKQLAQNQALARALLGGSGIAAGAQTD
jgi:hypothetical protein